VLTNLMTAQIAESNAGNQLSTTETSSDLAGYGAGAEALTAMQAVGVQVNGYLSNAQTVSAQLSTQDTALNEVANSATTATQAITQAIASGNGTTLMQALQNAFSTAVGGLNTTFNGEYLLSGGLSTTQPVTAANLSDLTAAPSIASLFQNGQLQTTTQVDQNTTVNTGMLASTVGTPLFQALKTIEAYDQGPNGPFGATLTTVQLTFLSSQITTFSSVQTGLNNIVGENGLSENEVTNAQNDLSQRQTLLQNLIGNVTNADLAQATTNLQQAQLSIQAAARVFQTLNDSSLLNSLSSPAPIS
ncbi:MAG: flagellin, partial [Caulobacteraceae bacterium]